MDKKDSDNSLVKEVLARYDRGYNFIRATREEMQNDLQFRWGEQWPDAVKTVRESDERPCLTINRVPQFIRQVTGDMRMSQPTIKVRGNDDKADKATAEVLTGLIRNIENNSIAKEAYFLGADSQVTSGIGHWRVDTKYVDDDSFDQDLVILPINDQLGVVWDPDAKRITREDAMWCIVPYEMSKDSFEAQFPEANISDFENLDQTDVGSWWTGESVRVAEYWKKVIVNKTLAQLEDGSVIDITGDKEKKAELEAAAAVGANIKIASRKSHRIKRYIVSAAAILEGPVDWPGKYFPIIPVIGEYGQVGKRLMMAGIVRHAKDAQRAYNYHRSAQIEAVALQPKAPYIGTHTHFADNKEIWANANVKNYAYLSFTPDPQAPMTKPERVSPPSTSPGLSEQVAIASDEMKATTGIYDAALGARSNETSGKAINARQRESDVGQFVYIDNWARAIEHTGKILVDLIPYYYDTERKVRILNEDGTEDEAIVNAVRIGPDGEEVVEHDLSVGKYDVTINVGPSFTTKRAEAAEGMREFMQSVPGVAPVIADLYVKAQDWPMADDIAERIRAASNPPGDDQPGPDGMPPPPVPPNPDDFLQ